MKKLLASCLLLFTVYSLLFTPVFAACNPPQDYTDCPELHPDLNLTNRGYEPIAGHPDLIPFDHPIDSNAPQLSTLIEGNARPTISSLYQVYDWDWSNNTKGGLYQKPPDAPDDFATLAGFSTQPGQGVLVPDSGYDLGEGYEATVLFATSNSITLNYTREGNAAAGYTLHLENFRVNPELLDLYNKLNRQGRAELPALFAGEKIGEASSAEILVSIRDTGSFMDPRWLNDWWQRLDPAVARELILKWLAIQEMPGFGVCRSETPGNEGVGIAWGKTFKVKIPFSLFGPSPKQQLTMTLKGLKFNFPDNQEMNEPLEEASEKLTPAGYSPKLSEKTSMGEVWYEVCDTDSKEHFTVKGDVSFDTPAWMDFMASLGINLSDLLTSNAAGGSQVQDINDSQVAGVKALAQSQSCSADASHEIVPSCAACGQILFCFGNKFRLCSTSDKIPSPTGNGTWRLDPADLGESILYNGSTFAVPSGGIYVCDANVYGCNNKCFDEQAGLPSQPRSFCEEYAAQGEGQDFDEICIGGECKREITASIPQQIVNQINQFISGLIEKVTGAKTFLVTPVIKTPYGQTIDSTLRARTFSTFKPSVLDLPFKHALTPAEHQTSALLFTEQYESDSEIYGQKGVKDAHQWVEEALTPAALRF